jgi:hypothetical protein
VCRLQGGVAWIGGDVKRGQRVAILATGYAPQRISTAAIEKAWEAYATVSDAVAYTIIQGGHEFWVISFPTRNATWVYDATLGEWHQRGWGGVVATTIAANVATGSQTVTPAAMTNIAVGTSLVVANADGSHSETVVVTGVASTTFTATFASTKTGPGITVSGTEWNRQRGAFHACIGIGTVNEVHYVGDWESGKIYKMSAAYVDDAGIAIHRRRRAPHLSNENKRRFYSRFQLDCDTGQANIQGEAPRVFWNRCGKSRDRIFQVDDDGAGNLTLSYSNDRCLSFITRSAIAVAPAAAALTLAAAYLEFTEGTG